MEYIINYMHSPSRKNSDERKMRERIALRNTKARRKVLRQQKKIRDWGEGKVRPPQRKHKDVERISKWVENFLLMSPSSRTDLLNKVEKVRDSLLSSSDAVFGKVNYEIHLIKEALKNVHCIEASRRKTPKKKTLKNLAQQKRSAKQQKAAEKESLKTTKNLKKQQRVLQLQAEKESLKAVKKHNKQVEVEKKALKTSQRSQRNAFLSRMQEHRKKP